MDHHFENQFNLKVFMTFKFDKISLFYLNFTIHFSLKIIFFLIFNFQEFKH